MPPPFQIEFYKNREQLPPKCELFQPGEGWATAVAIEKNGRLPVPERRLELGLKYPGYDVWEAPVPDRDALFGCGVVPCRGVAVFTFGGSVRAYNYSYDTVVAFSPAPCTDGVVAVRLGEVADPAALEKLKDLPEVVWRQFGSRSKQGAYALVAFTRNDTQWWFSRRDDVTGELYPYQVSRALLLTPRHATRERDTAF